MSGHRLGTDRQQTVVVAGCPNDCQAFELETTGDPDAIDDLVEEVEEAFGECSACGGSIGFLRKDEPKEELE